MSWEQVGKLTLPRYQAIYRYLAAHPPVQWMVAAYLGIKGDDRGSGGSANRGDYIDVNDLDLPPGGLSIYR
jgi:hypothetical protein